MVIAKSNKVTTVTSTEVPGSLLFPAWPPPLVLSRILIMVARVETVLEEEGRRGGSSDRRRTRLKTTGLSCSTTYLLASSDGARGGVMMCRN
jgi:hypothetical protein